MLRLNVVRRYSLTALALSCVVACDTNHSPSVSGPTDVPPPADTTTHNTPLVYQFGAKFEPPMGRVVHGMGQWVNYNPQYLALLPSNEKPASELEFVELDDTSRPWDPNKIAQRMAAIGNAGRVPLMDLAPRGNQPMPADLALLPNPYYGIDSAIAYTLQWDARIQEFINVVKSYAKPVMMRIGGEFNGNWNGYHPYAYPVAFRKIVNMFRAAGVTNVAFVWCYEPAAANDFDAVDAAGNYKWYPGDDVVDWFSIDLYGTGDISGVTSAHGTISPYGKTLRFLDMAVAKHKPVVIAESSPMQFNLANASDAAASWTQWFTPYFALIESRSEIKWFMYVNYDWSMASYYASQGWKNNDMSASSSLAAQYVAELSKAKYLHANELSLLKGWY